MTTLPAWDNDVLERGYHNFTLLLKDGRILIGGGTAKGYAVTCDRADARVFSPPYPTSGERPVPGNLSEGLVMNVGIHVSLRQLPSPWRSGDIGAPAHHRGRVHHRPRHRIHQHP